MKSRDPRNRLHKGFSIVRVKLEAKRAARPLLILAVGGVVGFLSWAVLVGKVGKQLYKGGDEITFTVRDATGVVPGRQEVRFKGIPAGLITDVKPTDSGAVALSVKVYDEYGPIYRNAQASLRPNTALQDFYLNITDRGDRSAGLATRTAPVPLDQTAISVQPADVLQAFTPDVRGRLSTTLEQLGVGLEGRGTALRWAVGQLAPLLNTAHRLSDQLADRSRMTKRLIHDAAILTGTLGERQTQLREFVTHTGTVLKTLEDGSADLGATLSELPPTLASLDRSFVAVQGVLPDVNGALRSLGPVAERLPSGLQAIRGLSEDALPAVSALQQPVTRLTPLANDLRPLAASLRKAMTRLEPQVPAVDHVTKTVAGCSVALQGFFQWTPSLTKFGDAGIIPIRGDLTASFGSSSVGQDPNIRVLDSCAPGKPIGGVPGKTLEARP